MHDPSVLGRSTESRLPNRKYEWAKMKTQYHRGSQPQTRQKKRAFSEIDISQTEVAESEKRKNE
jgi:hypothetical protein